MKCHTFTTTFQQKRRTIFERFIKCTNNKLLSLKVHSNRKMFQKLYGLKKVITLLLIFEK